MSESQQIEQRHQKAYTPGEELANSISHGIGVALGIAALILLVIWGAEDGNVWMVVSCSIYGATLILAFLSSTLYHSFPQPKAKRVFKILDHASIYLLIAGTYTPFMLGGIRGGWGWSLFGVIWGLAFVGVLFKCFFVYKFRRLSIAIYLGMGWLVVVALKPLLGCLSTTGIVFFVAGGVCYTSGVAFYVWHKLRFNHAIWHGFVLAGSICHFFSIASLV